MTNQTPSVAVLLGRVDAYLTAMHSTGRHDHIGADYGCEGCALLADIRAHIPAPSAPAARAAVLTDEAALIEAHCPDHGPQDQDGVWMDCHCPVAEDMRKRAAVLRRMAGEAQQPTGCDHDSQVIDHEGHQYWACLKCGQNLGKVADEAQQPETQARLAAYQTCGVCKSGYPTGGSCGTCEFNARMGGESRQADTAGEQQ